MLSSIDNILQFAILMCTYNGEKYLQNQLDSFVRQTNKSWRLIVSDDGSQDQTLNILERFRDDVGPHRVEIRCGPCAGFSRNFMSLLCDKKIQAEYYALSDQDDIWSDNKLDLAYDLLTSRKSSMPVLYCGRSVFVDDINQFIALSKTPKKELSFKNALIENIASGNTMIINKLSHDLLLKCSDDISVYAHDWWLYILISGVGGQVYYDWRPLIRYRQHSHNIVGTNLSFGSKLKRLSQFLTGEFSSWSKLNTGSIEKIYPLLTEKNREIFDLFSQAQSSKGLKASQLLRASGVHRQSAIENIVLYAGAILGKI